MKSIYTRACLAALVMFGAMAAAQAAELPGSFNAVTTGGQAVAITPHRLASFECVGGQVNTVRVDSDQKYYIDTSGTLCGKLEAQAAGGKWIKQAGVRRYFQVIYDSSQCYAGQTMLNYNFGLMVNDGCALDADIKNKSN